METHKALTILKILFAGYPVVLEGRTWYLGGNSMLGIKMEHYTIDKDGNKQIKPGNEDEIHCVDWSLSRFIEVCNTLSDAEVKEICDVIKKEDTEILEVKSNKVLFDKGKWLGTEIRMLLSGMVQNDSFVEKAKLESWGKKLQQQVRKIIMHGNIIVEYIQNQLWEQYPDPNQEEDNRSVTDIAYDDIPF